MAAVLAAVRPEGSRDVEDWQMIGRLVSAALDETLAFPARAPFEAGSSSGSQAEASLVGAQPLSSVRCHDSTPVSSSSSARGLSCIESIPSGFFFPDVVYGSMRRCRRCPRSRRPSTRFCPQQDIPSSVVEFSLMNTRVQGSFRVRKPSVRRVGRQVRWSFYLSVRMPERASTVIEYGL